MSRRSRSAHSYRLAVVAVIVMVAAVVIPGLDPARAQDPSLKDVLKQDEVQEEGQAAAEPTPHGPVDELDRGTPRTSFLGLREALQEGDYERAAEYLDLRNLPGEVEAVGGPELARRLEIVLDRALWVDVDTLSREARGIADDGLPAYRDSLGRIELHDRPVHIFMQRVPREDGVSIWKISNATIKVVPELHEIYGYGEIGEKLSSVMPDFELLGLQSWQWLMVVGLIVAGYLVALVPTWVVARILRHRGRPMSDEIARFVSGPIRWFVAILVGRAWIDLIHPGVEARAWMEGHTLLTIVTAWVLIRLVAVFHHDWARRMEARGRPQAVVLMRPAASVVKWMILLLAVMIWFENLGFKATTLIAGLGIGGLAVALAAQKPIENLIGAITLFSSAPVRVGDFCRFGDKIGTVEEIGLRATKIRTLGRTAVYVPNATFADLQLENFAERERVWFHPKIRIRYDTTPDQVRYVLVEIRKLLYSHPKVDPDPARVRFVGYGESSLDLEIFAYVRTTDWGEYLEIAEDLNLRIMDIVVEAGTALAYPTQTLSLERGQPPDRDAAKRAEEKVQVWRERGELHLPRFPEEKISELRGTLPYPPEGSGKPPSR